MTKSSKSKRHLARALLLQALYQWHYSGDDITEIEVQFLETEEYLSVDGEYFRKLLFAVPASVTEIDALIAEFSKLPLTELSPVELSIIRLSTFELMHQIDIPYRVVINEALELAKTYGSEDGHKFVNGVLDKIAGRVRADETSSRKR